MEVQLIPLLLTIFAISVSLCLLVLCGVLLGGFLVYRTRRDSPFLRSLREPEGEGFNLDDSFVNTNETEDNEAEDWGSELIDRQTKRFEDQLARTYASGEYNPKEGKAA